MLWILHNFYNKGSKKKKNYIPKSISNISEKIANRVLTNLSQENDHIRFIPVKIHKNYMKSGNMYFCYINRIIYYLDVKKAFNKTAHLFIMLRTMNRNFSTDSVKPLSKFQRHFFLAEIHQTILKFV